MHYQPEPNRDYSREELLDKFIEYLGERYGFTLDSVHKGADDFIMDWYNSHDHSDRMHPKDLPFGWPEHQGIAAILHLMDWEERENILQEYDKGLTQIKQSKDPLALVSNAQIIAVAREGQNEVGR